MMSSKIVVLCSGGIDSSVILRLCQIQKLNVFPLFINYGQLAKDKEWKSAKSQCVAAKCRKPEKIDVSDFGRLIPSGLTSRSLRLREDAFLPGRNHLFVLLGSSYAFRVGASQVAIGLLSDEFSIFPDQTSSFVGSLNDVISVTMGRKIQITAPLGHLNKAQVIKLADKMGISHTYSCHAGGLEPCGRCISCLEINTSTPIKEGGLHGRRRR